MFSVREGNIFFFFVKKKNTCRTSEKKHEHHIFWEICFKKCFLFLKNHSFLPENSITKRRFFTLVFSIFLSFSEQRPKARIKKQPLWTSVNLNLQVLWNFQCRDYKYLQTHCASKYWFLLKTRLIFVYLVKSKFQLENLFKTSSLKKFFLHIFLWVSFLKICLDFHLEFFGVKTSF